MVKHRYDFDGGTVALDFVNTVSGMRGFEPREHLLGWEELVDWARQAGLIPARSHPRMIAGALQQALRIREALHDVVVAAVDKRDAPAEALAEVTRWIADALAHRRLLPAGKGRYQMQFDRDDNPLAFLRPVALDAAELLERDLAGGLVRICEERALGRCGWIFLDQTKNHSRRFCSMKECGNRAKQRRFQQRKRML